MSLIHRLWHFKRAVLDGYAAKSYSQEGEDMVLRRVFDDRRSGFYVDVGAHHPKRFSNTYYFYRRGWRGLNIDAMPGSMRLFRRLRPRDINVEQAIGPDRRELTFYVFNEPAMNTLDPELASSREIGPFKVVREEKLTTRPLAEVLAEHVREGQRIDFLSVDVEGLDLVVLQSNDWSRFRPTFLLVECIGFDAANPAQNPTVQYLESLGYGMFAKTVQTVIFRDRTSS